MNHATPPRDDNETTNPAAARASRGVCPVCATPFTPNRRQTYCTNACRQTAHRRRRPPAEPVDVPPARSRRDHTIYQCTDCDTRYLAQQWCPDCNRPCRRLGPGGQCDCGELLTTTELLTGGPP